MFWYWSLILLVPALLLGIYAQVKVSSTFNRYSQVPSARGFTGAQGARLVLDSAGLYDVGIEVAGSRLSDHYDPRSRILTLSPDVGNSNSLAALGVAAHEAGHAMQHRRRLRCPSSSAALWCRWRTSAPISVSSCSSSVCSSSRKRLLMNIGIVLYCGGGALHPGHAPGGVQRLKPGDDTACRTGTSSWATNSQARRKY